MTNNFDLRPSLDCTNSLLYHKEALIRPHEEQWHKDINNISMQSDSGDRLSLRWNIKPNPGVEDYVSNTRSVGERHVMAGLRVGCLPLAIGTGRYTNTPFRERLCRLCGCKVVEDQVHFLTICPKFSHIRTQLFNRCATVDPNFYHYSLLLKTKSSLSQYKWSYCKANPKYIPPQTKYSILQLNGSSSFSCHNMPAVIFVPMYIVIFVTFCGQ